MAPVEETRKKLHKIVDMQLKLHDIEANAHVKRVPMDKETNDRLFHACEWCADRYLNLLRAAPDIYDFTKNKDVHEFENDVKEVDVFYHELSKEFRAYVKNMDNRLQESNERSGSKSTGSVKTVKSASKSGGKMHKKK